MHEFERVLIETGSSKRAYEGAQAAGYIQHTPGAQARVRNPTRARAAGIGTEDTRAALRFQTSSPPFMFFMEYSCIATPTAVSAHHPNQKGERAASCRGGAGDSRSRIPYPPGPWRRASAGRPPPSAEERTRRVSDLTAKSDSDGCVGRWHVPLTGRGRCCRKTRGCTGRSSCCGCASGRSSWQGWTRVCQQRSIVASSEEIMFTFRGTSSRRLAST